MLDSLRTHASVAGALTTLVMVARSSDPAPDFRYTLPVRGVSGRRGGWRGGWELSPSAEPPPPHGFSYLRIFRWQSPGWERSLETGHDTLDSRHTHLFNVCMPYDGWKVCVGVAWIPYLLKTGALGGQHFRSARYPYADVAAARPETAPRAVMPIETSAVWPSNARKSFTCLRRECRAVNYVTITKLEVFSYRAGHETIGLTAILIQGTLSRSCQVIYGPLVERGNSSLTLPGKPLFEKPAERLGQSILISEWRAEPGSPASGTPVGIASTRGTAKLRVQTVV